MDRSQREIAVLAAIVERFIRTGEPAPSSAIAGESRLGLSPASIRAVMVALTDQGYLEQPHVSAGRVPTAKAFQLYVDTVIAIKPLPANQRRAIAETLEQSDDMSQVLRRACGIVSSHCLQLGVALAPHRDEFRWRAMEFSPAGSHRVLAVLILDGGLVRTRMVPVPTEYTADELTRFSNYLNGTFKGCTLSEARDKIEAELAQAGERLEKMCRDALALSRPAVEPGAEDREVFMDGISQVSHTAGLEDASRLRELLALMEERPRLLDLLERTMNSRDISVSFVPGAGNALPWAVVSAPYSATGVRPIGVVSAIGLAHMNYATVLPVVAQIASSVAGVMRGRLESAQGVSR